MKSLWHKIKILFVIIVASAMSYGLFQLSTMADNNLLTKAKHERPLNRIKAVFEPQTGPDPIPFLEEGSRGNDELATGTYKTKAAVLIVDPDSPEIDNSDYVWMQGRIKACHPTMKDELREALANDGVIRKNEYKFILHEQCNTFTEAQDAGAKNELKKFLAQ